jgi:hypothetical protein
VDAITGTIPVGRLVLIVIALITFNVGCETTTESKEPARDLATQQEQISPGSLATTGELEKPAIKEPAPVGGTRPRAVLSEIHNFESFPVMVATSEAAIIGKVSAELESRFMGDARRPLEIHRFEVNLEETLAGTIDNPMIILEVDQVILSYLDDTTWTQPGERSVLFLKRILEKKRGVPIGSPFVYRLVNSQGAYRIVEQDRLESARNSDEFSQRVASWTLPELRAQIEAAKGQIERKEVEPQRHGFSSGQPPS